MYTAAHGSTPPHKACNSFRFLETEHHEDSSDPPLADVVRSHKYNTLAYYLDIEVRILRERMNDDSSRHATVRDVVAVTSSVHVGRK